jgi:zinc transporter 1/2/3
MVGATEYRVLVEGTATSDLPVSYTECHAHATQTQVNLPPQRHLEAALTDTLYSDGA